MFNKNFFPTPDNLISKMLSKIKNFNDIKTILEPSAGMGHIIDYIYETKRIGRHTDVFAIEKDTELQNFLRGKNFSDKNQKAGRKYNLIDSDFLSYNGIESFDLIIANFPFSDGEKHLHKAIDLMFNGQIVCLINAETLKNPFSNDRKRLVERLHVLGAEIQYIQNAFVDAERETGVEVALVYINIEANVEDDLFKELNTEDTPEIDIKENYDLESTKSIDSLVYRYNLEKENVRAFLLDYHSRSSLVRDYIEIKIIDEPHGDCEDLTSTIKHQLNSFSKKLKKKYWTMALSLDEIKTKLTGEKRKEFQEFLKQNDKLEFSKENIQQLLINLTQSLPEMMSDSVVDLFKKLTSYSLHDSHWGEEYKRNIHLFSGWKTNHAYKVQKKVIMPFYQDLRWDGKLQVSWEQERFLDDIDQVLRYFDRGVWKKSMSEYCKEALIEDQNRNIESDFFTISIYKKGTIHLKFKNDYILRMFNIEAGKKLNFLPENYGEKEYSTMEDKEKDIVDKFEGESSYEVILESNLLSASKLKVLEMVS